MIALRGAWIERIVLDEGAVVPNYTNLHLIRVYFRITIFNLTSHISPHTIQQTNKQA